jgi:polysaccharide deacetylase family protein (PEP-CTERM system associated)
MLDALSFDVEDWFHICEVDSLKPVEEWETYESRVLKNTKVILAMLKSRDIQATFFVLGWVAEHHPEVVEAIIKADKGHEIATHGHNHGLVNEQGRSEFRKDLEWAIKVIESVAGGNRKVIGYRAPAFSITPETKWAFDVMVDCGIRYDASVFPQEFQSDESANINSHTIYTIKTKSAKNKGALIEFPISHINAPGMRIRFGGAYFRLVPYGIFRGGIVKFHKKFGHPVIFYLHPRDLDPKQPHLRMGMKRRFNCYTGLGSAKANLKKLLDEFEWAPVSRVLKEKGFDI